jgi:arylsulfatase A-like enzyme
MPDSTDADANAPDNVLFVFTDQQRLDSLGCYGNDWVETPNLDRLAAEGTRYDRAYTPAAICSPARAAVVTGMYPHRNGITRNVGHDESFADDFPCYPGLLREAGYNAGHAGKWHVGQPPSAFGLDGEHYPGWYYPHEHEDYLSYLDERDLPRLTGDRLRDAFPEGGASFQSGAVDDRPVEASFTRFITERALERIGEYAAEYDDDGTPFYQGVHYFGPHNPYYIPEEYLHYYDPEDVEIPESAIKETLEGKPWAHRVQAKKANLRDVPIEDWRRMIAAYHGWVTFIDHEVGRLLDVLDERGLAGDTAVVFTSDHGAFLTRHKMHDKGPAMYEDIYNVPFLTRGLGEDGGRVEERFVSLLDLAPTFVDLAGGDVPDEYDGRSLLSIDGEWRDRITAEFHGHQFAYEQRMIRDDRHKLVLNEYDTAELYDLERDPNELDNRVGDPEYGEVAARLYDELMARLEAAGDSFVDGPIRKMSRASDVGIEGFEPDR